MLKRIVLAAAALACATPVLADGWHGNRGYHYGHYRPYPHYVHYRPVYVAPPRVIYAPPIVYGPPRLGIVARPAPGLSISLDLPL